ncbi:MAG: hypothetical protein DRJ56_08345, partial [Thermoprotei archaeon]
MRQLVHNPDLYSGPDFWYCIPGRYMSCYWLSSDIGSSGGVAQIYGALPRLASDSAFLVTEVTFPDVTILSATMELRARYASQPSRAVIFYLVGLYDPDAGAWAWGPVQFSPTTSYQVFTFSVSGVSPGASYWLVVGVYVALAPLGGVEDFRLDSAYLYVETGEYSFSGNVLGLLDR